MHCVRTLGIRTADQRWLDPEIGTIAPSTHDITEQVRVGRGVATSPGH